MQYCRCTCVDLLTRPNHQNTWLNTVCISANNRYVAILFFSRLHFHFFARMNYCKCMFWPKTPTLLTTNMARSCPQVSLKTSSGFTLTNVEKQSRNVVAGLAFMLSSTTDPLQLQICTSTNVNISVVYSKV